MLFRSPATPALQTALQTALIARGAYLAQVGNCAGCHTQRGGAAYAGGLAINTPFGAVYTSNLTPDVANGMGSWSQLDFWRAMHNGRSKNGRLLYPAFPYTNTTLVSRADSDALFAFLSQLAPVPQANTAHAVRFPYNSQLALAVWRGLYFKPGVFQPDSAQSADINRGAYLVGLKYSARQTANASGELYGKRTVCAVLAWGTAASWDKKANSASESARLTSVVLVYGKAGYNKRPFFDLPLCMARQKSS